MNSPILPLIKDVIIILLGLLVFLVLKDRLIEGKSLWKALKARALQSIMSPFFIPGFKILAAVAICYIVYTLFFK